MFLVSSDGVDTAARATRAELTAGDAGPGRDVEAVLEAFAAHPGSRNCGISHEALRTAWPLLRDPWLVETRADPQHRRARRSRART